MLYLSKNEIEKVITIKEVVDGVKKAFSMNERELIITPLRTLIPAKNGTLLFMPAYCEELGLAVLKNVNVFPNNEALGKTTTPAEIMLIDATNGYTLAILDGTYVTQLRTGAASGAAFDVLAKKECKIGALIGTGGQAEAQLDAMLAARKLEDVYVYSIHKDKCEEFVEKMRYKYNDVNFHCCDSSQECVKDADLIITVTTSEKPVFDGSLVKKGATISCVGNYEPNKQEIDPALIVKADKIHCDSKDAVLSESGDLLIPINMGLIKKEKISGGLGEVINGTLIGRENDDEIIVFKTVGIAAQDLITSAIIYKNINNN